ncbi:MAG: hypothetical protein HYS09_07150 [Chloroflexi bacterium]|nr:hypothetical protein [Chloroflexota bacterium]
MAARGFDAILDECLAALAQGLPLEACLARYPRHADELRPLLSVAQQVRRLPVARPRATAQAAAWQRFYHRSSALRMARPYRSFPWLRPLAIAASVLLALIVAGGGTIYAASKSQPDSFLYPLKLATEDARLWFVFDDKDKARILLDQSETRVEEITGLVDEDKETPGSVLSALRNRTARAIRLLEGESGPEADALRERALQLAAAHEQLLTSLWGDIAASARDDYAEAVATLHNAQLRINGRPGYVLPEDLGGGVTHLSGKATPGSEPSVWLIGGLEVHVGSAAIGGADLAPGRIAEAIVARGSDGLLRVLNLTVTGPAEQPVVITGIVQALEDNVVEVGGHRIALTEDTLSTLKLDLGSNVKITVVGSGDRVVATAVEAAPETGTEPGLLAWEGTTDQPLTDLTSLWEVGGQTFVITPATEIDAQAGDLDRGARVRVEAERQDGQLVAVRVLTLAGEAPDEEDVALEGVFEGVVDGRWQVSGVLVGPAGQAAPVAGTFVKVEGERKGDAMRARRFDSIYVQDGEPLVSVRGVLAATGEDAWRVGFSDVEVSDDTQVSGKPIVGARVQVWGRQTDGAFEAVYIDVLDSAPLPLADSD